MKEGASKKATTVMIIVIALLAIVIIGATVTGNSVFDWVFGSPANEASNNAPSEGGESDLSIGAANSANNDIKKCPPGGEVDCVANSRGSGTTIWEAVAKSLFNCQTKLNICKTNKYEDDLLGPKQICRDTKFARAFTGSRGAARYGCSVKDKEKIVEECRLVSCGNVKDGKFCTYPLWCFNEKGEIRNDESCEKEKKCRERTDKDPQNGEFWCDTDGKESVGFECVERVIAVWDDGSPPFWAKDL